MLACTSINYRVSATRIVANHASDHRSVLRRGFGREEKSVRSKSQIKFVTNNPWLYPHPSAPGIDLHDPIEVARHIDDDSGPDDLSSQRSAGGAEDQCRAVFAGKLDKVNNVLFALWQDDCLRHLALDRSIGRITRPHRRVETQDAC